MVDRDKFYKTARATIFGGKLSQKQVDGINAILDMADKYKLTDLRQLAYVLGTIMRECGKDMYPVREGFKSTDSASIQYVTNLYKLGKISKNYALPVNGKSYFGRGYVQITHLRNYQTFSNLLGMDLVTHPELALQVDISAEIAILGMIKGAFTGKRLADYFNSTKEDWVNARRIINGIDHANEVAGYAHLFYHCLTK